jgi:hypothetical protein
MPSASTIERLMAECLFEPNEPKEPYIEAVGVVHTFRFHPVRLAERLAAIREQLEGLPEEFQQRSPSGGGSFLNGCMDRFGIQWGEAYQVEALMCLGIASGFVRYCMPREYWGTLPGGVPYFLVLSPGPDKMSN